MATLFVLIPLAMVFVFIAIGAFVWAARSGQFDDMETPRVRVLFDDEDEAAPQGAGHSDEDPERAGPGRASGPIIMDARSFADRGARSPGASGRPQ